MDMLDRKVQLDKALEAATKDRERIIARLGAPLNDMHARLVKTIEDLEEQGYREGSWIFSLQAIVLEALTESIPACLDMAIETYRKASLEEIQHLPALAMRPAPATSKAQVVEGESIDGGEDTNERHS